MDPEEAIPRARAAWAYSRMDQKDLAAAASLHYDRLRAILGGGRPPKDVPIEELWAIAEAAGVPRWFMEHGFDPMKETVGDDLQETTTRLLAEVKVIKKAMAQAGIDLPVDRADLDAALREEERLRQEELGDEDRGEAGGQFG